MLWLKSSHSNFIFMHSICFSTEIGETKMTRKFRSLKFLEIFTKGNFSVDIHASRLQSCNDAYNDIVDVFDEIVDLVNYEGWWLFMNGAKKVCLMILVYWVMISSSLVIIRFLLRRYQLMLYIFTHQINIILNFLQFIESLLTTSNLTFLRYKYVIAINPNVGMSL